jgi:hypothetical protein
MDTEFDLVAWQLTWSRSTSRQVASCARYAARLAPPGTPSRCTGSESTGNPASRLNLSSDGGNPASRLNLSSDGGNPASKSELEDRLLRSGWIFCHWNKQNVVERLVFVVIKKCKFLDLCCLVFWSLCSDERVMYSNF